MGEVVNLNKVRKQKQREQKRARAARSRVQHGLSKAERAEQAKKKAREDRHLEGHKLDSEPPPSNAD